MPNSLSCHPAGAARCALSAGGDLLYPNLAMPSDLAANRGRRILLIEDNRDLHQIVRRLAERRGHQVFVASTGAAALGLVVGLPFDVIVLDMELPDMDGHEVLARLKQDDRTQRIPVLVWSGRADDYADGQASPVPSADGYLQKGSAQALIQMIEVLLLTIEQGKC